jgi:hypothetical protein
MTATVPKKFAEATVTATSCVFSERRRLRALNASEMHPNAMVFSLSEVPAFARRAGFSAICRLPDFDRGDVFGPDANATRPFTVLAGVPQPCSQNPPPPSSKAHLILLDRTDAVEAKVGESTDARCRSASQEGRDHRFTR